MKYLRALRAALPHSPPPTTTLQRRHPIKCPCPPCGGTSGDPGVCPDPCGNNRPCCGEPPPQPKPVCRSAPPTKPAGPPDPCLKKDPWPKKDPCPPKADHGSPKRTGKKCITPISPTPEDCNRAHVSVFCRIEAARAARQAAYEAESRCRQPSQPPAACCYAPLVSVPHRGVERCADPPGRCPPPPTRYAAAPPGRPPPPAVCTLRSPRYLARYPDPPAPERTCAAAGRRDPCARRTYNEITHDHCAMPDGGEAGETRQARRQPCAEPRGGRCEPRAGDERGAFQPPRPQPCPPAVRYPYRPARYPHS